MGGVFILGGCIKWRGFGRREIDSCIVVHELGIPRQIEQTN
jgi:hypothetical protein